MVYLRQQRFLFKFFTWYLLGLMDNADGDTLYIMGLHLVHSS